MSDARWYGRSWPLDPHAVQLRLHVDVARTFRPVSARLFQVPSAEARGDSPLWQHVTGWQVDPCAVAPLRTLDDALGAIAEATMQLRLPGIG